MRPTLLTVPAVLASLMLAPPLVSAHQAHQHGVAELDLVREGDEMEIQLKVDGQGVVGFERAPRDDAERSKVEAARLALGEASTLFRLPAGAGCRLVFGDVDMPHAVTPDADHSGAGAASESHADWRASYRYECERGEAADSVDLAGLFTAFPGIAQARLQWITDAAQSGAELHPGRSQASLVAE